MHRFSSRLALIGIVGFAVSGCTSAGSVLNLAGAADALSEFSSLPATGHMVAKAHGTTITPSLLEQRMRASSVAFLPRGQQVDYSGSEEPGTIVIEQARKGLYLVEADGKAIRYTVAIGAVQNQWTGESSVTAVHLQPGWTAPPSLWRNGVPGAVIPSGDPANPMGIGALTLSGGDYAIHGTNRPDKIGQAVSGGCFRMHNEDIADLMRRVRVGTRVIVRS